MRLKQAYQALLHMNQPDLPRVQRQWAHLLLPSDQLHHSGYKHIWRSGIPRPFVDITYNILNNSLPTSCKALHCSNAPCPFCHAAADTIPHVLFECTPAVSLWSWACRIFRRWKPHATFPSPFTFQLWLHKCVYDYNDITDWLFWSCAVLKTLWSLHNDVSHGKQAWSTRAMRHYPITQWPGEPRS